MQIGYEWEREGLGYLTESLRMEEADVFGLSLAHYPAVFRGLRDGRTQHYLAGLRREITHARRHP